MVSSSHTGGFWHTGAANCSPGQAEQLGREGAVRGSHASAHSPTYLDSGPERPLQEGTGHPWASCASVSVPFGSVGARVSHPDIILTRLVT